MDSKYFYFKMKEIVALHLRHQKSPATFLTRRNVSLE